jgi:type I restriction enzyme S subunit
MSEVLLNDICELIVDCPHTTAVDEGHGYPLVRTPNIGKGRLVYNGMHRVSEDVYNKRNFRAVPQEDDLIFAREATAGNVALIQKGEKVCLGQRTVLLRPNKALVNPIFLTYFLLAPKQQYNLLCTANGATVAHVNMSTIRNLKLELPHLQIQNKIGMILSRYDSLIENYQKQIKLLEESAQRLYKEWFIDLRFPGHENTKIVDGVPEGWEKEKLRTLVEFKRGKTITKKEVVEGSIPVVAGGLEPAYYCNKFNTSERVITISGSGANAGYTRMYFEKVWASDCSFADSSMTPYLHFVFCFLRDNKTIIDNMQKGAAQPHVYAKDINLMETCIPTENVLKSFEERASKYFDTISSLQSQIRHLTEARDRLLPKLMSGEIKV